MRAGATALADYEMLELVLFRAIPRRDVKPIAKRLLAEGEKTRLEASYEKFDTSNVERLSVGDHTPRVIVEGEGE